VEQSKLINRGRFILPQKEVYMFIGLLRSKKEIEDLIFTLEICIKELSADAHPAHQQRIDELISDLKRQCK
jgi:hypothetical protein